MDYGSLGERRDQLKNPKERKLPENAQMMDMRFSFEVKRLYREIDTRACADPGGGGVRSSAEYFEYVGHHRHASWRFACRLIMVRL